MGRQGVARAKRPKRGKRREGREEISADADATDSLMAEFPATKFGGHPLAAAPLKISKITAQHKIARGIFRQIQVRPWPLAPAGLYSNVIYLLYSSSSFCNDESHFTRKHTCSTISEGMEGTIKKNTPPTHEFLSQYP